MDKEFILSGVSFPEFYSKLEEIIERKFSSLSPPSMDPTYGYISRKEAAALLKVTLPTLHDYTKQGWLKHYKIGNRVLYKAVEVEQCIEGLTSLKSRKGGHHA